MRCDRKCDGAQRNWNSIFCQTDMSLWEVNRLCKCSALSDWRMQWFRNGSGSQWKEIRHLLRLPVLPLQNWHNHNVSRVLAITAQFSCLNNLSAGRVASQTMHLVPGTHFLFLQSGTTLQPELHWAQSRSCCQSPSSTRRWAWGSGAQIQRHTTVSRPKDV